MPVKNAVRVNKRVPVKNRARVNELVPVEACEWVGKLVQPSNVHPNRNSLAPSPDAFLRKQMYISGHIHRNPQEALSDTLQTEVSSSIIAPQFSQDHPASRMGTEDGTAAL